MRLRINGGKKMDIKSLMDELMVKNGELEALQTKASELKSKVLVENDVDELEGLDSKLTENELEINNLQKDIDDLQNKIDNENKSGGKTMKNYLQTNKAMTDWAAIIKNSADKNEANEKWLETLTSNGVTIEGETSLLPGKIELAITSTISRNPIYDAMQHTGSGTLVHRKFNSDDTAIVRGTGYNYTETKTEQNSVLEIKELPQTEIYKQTSVSYKALKAMGSALSEFITAEEIQHVIDRIVDLGLYDGTGNTNGKDTTNGFDAIVGKDSGAIHVEYDKAAMTLAKAIRANAFRATGAGAVVIQKDGNVESTNSTMLIVNSADYGEILAEALELNYNVDNMPAWLCVGKIVVKDTTSANYKPIVMAENAYIVAADESFDKFDWYNILNNRNVSEVVTLASGTLYEANSAVVFTPKAAAGK